MANYSVALGAEVMLLAGRGNQKLGSENLTSAAGWIDLVGGRAESRV